MAMARHLATRAGCWPTRIEVVAVAVRRTSDEGCSRHRTSAAAAGQEPRKPATCRAGAEASEESSGKRLSSLLIGGDATRRRQRQNASKCGHPCSAVASCRVPPPSPPTFTAPLLLLTPTRSKHWPVARASREYSAGAKTKLVLEVR
jgi:hypothetical protein